MFATWTDDLLTGNETIDNQHKEIFHRINKLYEAANEYQELYQLKKVGDRRLKETLHFLADYVEEHFRDEEEYMKQNNYEKFEEHKKSHDEFKKQIEKELEIFEKEGPNLPRIINLLKLTNKWLIEHIKKADLEMIQAIKAKN